MTSLPLQHLIAAAGLATPQERLTQAECDAETAAYVAAMKGQ